MADRLTLPTSACLALALLAGAAQAGTICSDAGGCGAAVASEHRVAEISPRPPVDTSPLARRFGFPEVPDEEILELFRRIMAERARAAPEGRSP